MPYARSVPDTTTTRLATARWVLMGLFALTGLMCSSWLTRLTSVRDALGMSPRGLGGVLLAGAVGGMVAVTTAGVVVDRWGGRMALLVSTGGVTAAYRLLAVGPTGRS